MIPHARNNMPLGELDPEAPRTVAGDLAQAITANKAAFHTLNLVLRVVIVGRILS